MICTHCQKPIEAFVNLTNGRDVRHVHDGKITCLNEVGVPGRAMRNFNEKL